MHKKKKNSLSHQCHCGAAKKESSARVMRLKMCISDIIMRPLIVCVTSTWTLDPVGWMKVCASACCIDRSSTASLGTSQFQNGQYNNKKSVKKTLPPPNPTVTCLRHHQAQVHLFCVACFKGFCHHQQKSREDNFLEFGLAVPFWRYARCGIPLSLSFPLGRSIVKQVHLSWRPQVRISPTP